MYVCTVITISLFFLHRFPKENNWKMLLGLVLMSYVWTQSSGIGAKILQSTASRQSRCQAPRVGAKSQEPRDKSLHCNNSSIWPQPFICTRYYQRQWPQGTRQETQKVSNIYGTDKLKLLSLFTWNIFKFCEDQPYVLLGASLSVCPFWGTAVSALGHVLSCGTRILAFEGRSIPSDYVLEETSTSFLAQCTSR
jgi:hypothetical protein